MSHTMFRKPSLPPAKIVQKKMDGPKPYRARLPMLLPIETSQRLLHNPKFNVVLPKLKQLAHTPDDKYDSLYFKSLENFANYVQQLPSKRNIHFDSPNGMLLLGLLRAFQTLKLYREHSPLNSYARDKVPANIALWSYALFTAALFLGVGEIYATYWISLCDGHGLFGRHWQPKLGPMNLYPETHYRYAFEQESRDAISQLDTLVSAEKLLPEEGLAWIASDKYIYELWAAILTGDVGRAGPFAGFILPSEDILIEQHQDLIESLDDLLLHEQRERLAEEHHEELIIELSDTPIPEEGEEKNPGVREKDRIKRQKLNLELPNKGSTLYVNIKDVTGFMPGDIMYAIMLATGHRGITMDPWTKMTPEGIVIPSTMIEVFLRAFPNAFGALQSSKAYIGTTRDGSLVLDPAAGMPGKILPRVQASTPQTTLISTPQAHQTPQNQPKMRG